MTSPAFAGIELGVQSASRRGELYQLNPLSDPRWEAFVQDHPDASVFHSTKWLRALHTAYGYKTAVMTTCPESAPLTNGLVFCRVESWLTGRRLVSLPFSDHCELLADESEELDDLLSLMTSQVASEKWKYLELRPVSSRPSTLDCFTQTGDYYLHRLNLNEGTRDLFENFHKSCVQRKIRRAEREKLRYEEGRSEMLFQHFYNLLVMTRRRLFLPPQPQSWFRALIGTFGPDLKIRVAFKDDLPVASILTLSHKKTMVYKYGCSDARYNNLGAMALLFWNTIQDAKANGLKELDLGRSDRDNQGLITYKEHWGAVGTLLNYWRYPAHVSAKSGAWKERMRRRVIPNLPSPVLQAVGALLYAHMG